MTANDMEPLSVSESAGPRFASHRLVWALAFTPLLFAPFSIALEFLPIKSLLAHGLGLLLLNVLSLALMIRLMAMDRRRLRESGYDTTGLSLLYVFFIPVWFYRRGRIANKKGPGWVFFLSIVISCGISGGIEGAMVGAEVGRAQNALKAGRYQEAMQSADKLEARHPWLPPAANPAPHLIRAAASLGFAVEAMKTGDLNSARIRLTDAKRVAQPVGQVAQPLLAQVSQVEAQVEQAEKAKTQDVSTPAPGTDAAIRAALSLLRTALKQFQATRGSFPSDLQEVVSAGFLPQLPGNMVPGRHPLNNEVHVFKGLTDAGPADTGGWGYYNEPSSKDFGGVFVNCTHTDATGRGWDSY